MAVGIKDIANKAGVSVATVSYTLNNTKHVSDSTRKRILEAMEELSYTPNYLAKSLKENKTKVVGLVLPDISNYFFTEIATGVESELNSLGYNVILCNSNEDLELEIRHIRQLRSYMVSGMIIAATTFDYDYRSLINTADYPLVFIDRRLSKPQGDSVTVDSFTAVCNAVEHLIEKGHKTIGFIGANQNLSTTKDRFEGYIRALEKHGIPFEPSLTGFGDAKIESAQKLCHNIMAHRPTALMVSSSLMSVGAVQYLALNGIKVPDEVAVIGYDDYIWSLITNPPLSTIRQPIMEIGRKAAQLIVDRINHSDAEMQDIVLPAELILRQSC